MIFDICTHLKPFGFSPNARAPSSTSQKSRQSKFGLKISPKPLSPKYTYFISSLISGVKNSRHKIFEIFQYILRHPPVLHCAMSQSNTINNIELLFMEFTYICIRTILH